MFVRGVEEIDLKGLRVNRACLKRVIERRGGSIRGLGFGIYYGLPDLDYLKKYVISPS